MYFKGAMSAGSFFFTEGETKEVSVVVVSHATICNNYFLFGAFILLGVNVKII